METWGFEEKTILTWRKVTNDRQKQRIGMGRYLRNSTEHCLFGVRGRLPSEGPKDIPSCFDAPRGLHSRKPDEAYEIIRAISPGPRLSMFAREQRAGFDLWGNEAMGEDAA